MTSATTTLVGTTLGKDRYRVTRKLGEGGMALVYLAEDTNVGVDVVIKVPKPIILSEPEFAHRFRREIRSMVQLAHPHIVKIKDVGEHQGLPYYVMELLTGGSLEDRLRKQVAANCVGMMPASLADWLEAVASALDFIHGQGVIHRDIKPANILFDGHGNAFVSDFGIAKAISGERAAKQTVMTQAGMVLGTGPYLAPEVSLGEAYDGKADQYALAAAVYEVLGGRVPFAGTSLHAVILQQTSGQIPPLHELSALVTKSLSQAIEVGLHRDAKKRYPSCMAFAKAVLAAAKGTPSAAPKPARPAAGRHRMTCPSCKESFQLPTNPEGTTVSCPACGAKYAVAKKPSAPEASETGQSAAPNAHTRVERPGKASRSSKQASLYLFAGFGVGVLGLTCAGLLFLWGAWSLVFGTKKGTPDAVATGTLEKDPAVAARPAPAPIAGPPKDSSFKSKSAPSENAAPPVAIIPPAPQPAPPPLNQPKNLGADLGPGIFLFQSMARVTDWAARTDKAGAYGYDNGVSIMSAWVNRGKSVTFRNPLVANTDYKLVAAGDNDAQAIGLEVFDDVTKQRVAQDQTGRPEAIVAFRPSASRSYSARLTLIQSREIFPCMCSLVWLKRSGWSIPLKTLDKATLSIAKRVAALNNAQQGKKYEYTRVPSQWAVFGGALNPGAELSINNVNLGTGDRVVMAACDGIANRLDLDLRKGKAFNSYQGIPTNEPLISQKSFLGLGYTLRVRNSSTLTGASVVMMAVVDVTK